MSVTIPLTKGFVAVVDTEDLPRVSQHSWSVQHGKKKTNYAVARISGCKVYLHRFILQVYDPKVQVDHRDNDGLNCRKQNLRVCDNSHNGANKPKQSNNTSGYKGVTFDAARGKWKSYIKKGSFLHQKRFDTAIEAARDYDKMAKILFGPFAQLNFPEGSSGSQE